MKHVSFRLMMVLGLTAAFLTGCSRDPNVRKQKYFESGQRYFAKGKYREAAIQFRNATEVDPTFAAAHYQMAEAFSKLQDWQHAYSELNRTIELQPDNYKAHQEIATLLIASGQPEGLKLAQDHADVLQKKFPNDAETHIVLSSLLGKEKKYNEAITEAKNAITLSPNNGDYYLRLAVLQAEANLPDAAEENFKKAIDLKATTLNPHLALAGFYQGRSRYAEAEQQVQQVIASDPKDADSRAALVKLYMAEGKRAEAESFLKQVKQQFPDNSVGYRMLGDFYYAVGDLDKATAEYESLYHDHPKDLLVEKNYVQLLLLKNRLDDAKKINDATLKAHAKDPEALTFRGEIQMRQGKPGDAVQTLQSVVSSNPGMAMAHYQLGLAEAQTGDMDRAATEWRQGVQLNPSMVEAHRALAAYAMQKKDMSGLEQEATQIIGLQPASADGYALRAFTFTQRKQFAGSEQDARKAIELAPQSAIGYLQMGNLRVAQGKLAESESWFKQAMTHDPTSSDGLHNLMQVYVAEKHPEKAIAAAQEQIKLGPNNSAFYTLLGSTQMTSKDYAGAQASLQKAVELNKTNPEAYLLLIRSQYLAGNYDAGLATCASAERDNPKVSAFFALEGSGHESKHDLEAARSAYQKALDLRRDDPAISNNLAYVLLETNSNPDLALQLAQTARRAMPENANVADTLGWAFYQKGVNQSAISMFQEAIKLAAKNKEPESATYHYHLGLAYEKAAQPSQAKENFERVLKINPNYADAADVKKHLAQLKS